MYRLSLSLYVVSIEISGTGFGEILKDTCLDKLKRERKQIELIDECELSEMILEILSLSVELRQEIKEELFGCYLNQYTDDAFQ